MWVPNTIINRNTKIASIQTQLACSWQINYFKRHFHYFKIGQSVAHCVCKYIHVHIIHELMIFKNYTDVYHMPLHKDGEGSITTDRSHNDPSIAMIAVIIQTRLISPPANWRFPRFVAKSLMRAVHRSVSIWFPWCWWPVGRLSMTG